MANVTVRLIGGPTALLHYGGLRWLTDPTFSPPGAYGSLEKVTGPALAPADVAPVDVVLLSHDHHADNLDPAGRAMLPQAHTVLTTAAAADRLGGNAIAMEPWSGVTLDAPEGGTVSIMAVPARHGPAGSEPETGPVIGFVLSGEGLPRVYVSGDNASIDVVHAVAAGTGRIDVAILFAGGVQLARRFDGAYLTLSADLAAQAARILDARAVIPVHFEGWSHFTQGADALRAAFAGNSVSDRLHLIQPGESVSVQHAGSFTPAV